MSNILTIRKIKMIKPILPLKKCDFTLLKKNSLYMNIYDKI